MDLNSILAFVIFGLCIVEFALVFRIGQSLKKIGWLIEQSDSVRDSLNESNCFMRYNKVAFEHPNAYQTVVDMSKSKLALDFQVAEAFKEVGNDIGNLTQRLDSHCQLFSEMPCAVKSAKKIHKREEKQG